MSFSKLVEKVKRGETITLDEVLSNAPSRYHERIFEVNKKINVIHLVYLLGVTEFYGGLERSFEIIEKTVPNRIEITSNEDREARKNSLPSLKKFYNEQRSLYFKRIANCTPHSLISLEVGIEAAYAAKTTAPPFGSHRNIGLFGQSDGEINWTS